MRTRTLRAALLALLLFVPVPASAENPLFLSGEEPGPAPLSASEIGELKKEGEALKRKAELLKKAADKKYASSAELRAKAGGFRSAASAKGDALRSQAEASAAVSGFIGDMFGIMSGMGGGGFSSNGALSQALTGQMIKGMQAADAKGVSDAHGTANQLSVEADRKAGPLEMRADELENEGNKLMEAHNRLLAIANAKFLLAASEELLKKVDADGRALERLREGARDPAAPTAAR
jgi:hypothetical protein